MIPGNTHAHAFMFSDSKLFFTALQSLKGFLVQHTHTHILQTHTKHMCKVSLLTRIQREDRDVEPQSWNYENLMSFGPLISPLEPRIFYLQYVSIQRSLHVCLSHFKCSPFLYSRCADESNPEAKLIPPSSPVTIFTSVQWLLQCRKRYYRERRRGFSVFLFWLLKPCR